MNTPSKEALDAAENVQDYWGFPRRATIDLATIIDRHFEPLRKRLAEMESLLESEKATRNAIIAKGQQAEARVKELDELYRDLRVAYEQNAEQCVKLNRELGLKKETTEWLNGTTIQRARAEQAEDRVKELEAEAIALRAANAELQKQESESRRLFYSEQDKRQSAEFRCEELAEALRPFAEFANKWDKNPIRGLDDALYSIHNEASLRLSDCKTARAALAHHAAGEPAKHPDTEIIDRFEEMCGSLEYCDADEVRNHWRAYGYSGSNEGVGRTMRDALRAATDAARKEVQP